MSTSVALSTTAQLFSCPTCGQELSRRGDLKRHLAQLHPTGHEKLWKCPHCPYAHVQKSNVKIHAEKHELKRTGERPHACPEHGCTAAYQDKGLLTRHRKKKHGYQPSHSPRYLERKGMSPSGDILFTHCMDIENIHPQRELSQIPDVSKPLLKTFSAPSLLSLPTEPFDTVILAVRSPPSSILAPLLPSVKDLLECVDERERARPTSPPTPHFPGPLAPAPIAGLRRPCSTQARANVYAPEPQQTRMFKCSLTMPPPVHWRLHSPTSPSYQTSSQSPVITLRECHSAPSSISGPVRTSKQHRHMPYPIARCPDTMVSPAPRWRKWWMIPAEFRDTSKMRDVSHGSATRSQ